MKYMVLYSIRERALSNKNFALIKEVEDTLFDAEESLVRWALDNCEAGGMWKEDTDFLRNNWQTKVDPVLELALRFRI
ncbi:hypothetical protein NDK43_26030 [Neobacillus pocheonensis]|uniref:Uncharacterized protein n=1 Tax=Neobacillus pocheonensis TaxID=363869 RepID=A0ABT0WFU1_9BACI|nr:hypothetical protein [Neobacillus pocheonensis]